VGYLAVSGYIMNTEDCTIAANKSYKGRYIPKRPEKYRGDPEMCFYRSLWERRFMTFCDENDTVVEWSSEEVVVPYTSPLDGRRHRYFVDFWVRLRKPDGSIEESLIEVKPKKQTVKPTKPTTKRVSKSKITEIKNWLVNSAKWAAARDYCEDKGWKFRVLTEEHIFGKKASA
jgi:hypothetical protein